MQLEEVVLGGLMLDNEKIHDVEPLLSPESFVNPSNGNLYRHILQFHYEGKPFDVISISEQMGDKWINACGEMTGLAARFGNTVPHARKIQENHIGRMLNKKCADVIKQINGKANPQEMIDDLGMFLNGLEIQREKELRPIGETMGEFVDDLQMRYEQKGDFIGLGTGLADLDKSIQGMQDGNLIIIAGRPAMGKSVLAQNIATHNADNGKTVLFYSLEMTELEIQQRVVSSVSRTSYGDIQTAKCVDKCDSMAMISDAIGKIRKMNLCVEDRSSLSIQELKSSAISHSRKRGKIDLLVVDYLQLLTAKAESRLQEVSLISRELKALAKLLGCPIIALSQLNRGLESRADKRPMVSDLRESGQLEQDADKILFIYRDEVYNPNTECKGLAEIIIGKARNCSKNDVVTIFDGATQSFKNADHYEFDKIEKLKQPKQQKRFGKQYEGNF